MRVAAVLLVAATGLAGCSVLAPAPAEEVVAQRSQERMDLLMAGEWREAYLYTTPSYRATETAPMYRSRYGGVAMWRSAAVDSVVCDGPEPTRCEVLTTVMWKPVLGGFVQPRILEETWIYTEKNWYMFEE